MIASKHNALLLLVILCIANSFRLIGSNSSFCPHIEKQALLSFKKSLNDPSNLLSSWNIDVDCCKWEGVVCSNSTGHGHVHQLHLRSHDHEAQSLHGKVNLSSLLHLKHLTYLDLSQNMFEGTIPSLIGSFTNLEYLNLSHAGFHGRVPHNMGNLSNLHTLILEDFGLNVDSLEWLSRLVELRQLNMNFVDLNKAIDWLQVINTLPSLVELHLSSCRLEFAAPLPHVNETSLTFLDLSRNEFSSFSVARWVFRQSNLVFLNLSRNNIEESSVPAISNTTKLQYIDLSFNKLSSTIPDWLYFCKDLEFVYLGHNSIQGAISKDIANLTSIRTLSLRFNQLSGAIPREIANLCKLRRLDLARNKLQGQISDSFGNMSDCFLESLAMLRLRQNQLSGQINNQFGKFKSLKVLDLTSNSISGAIPNDLGKLSCLDRLWLGFNSLRGDFPMSLGQLSNLTSLSIGHNMLEGVVNESHFSNLAKLKYLFASGNNLSLKVSPNWIPPFQLVEIGIGSWNLETSSSSRIIPSWIEMQRSSISFLDLSNTGISGNVPSWVWGISVLNLSHNHLHGNIPDFKPRGNHDVFPDHRRIYLSANKFNGSLPRVSNDTVELDLSNNSFSGGMSHFLCDMENERTYILKILHLAENKLSGEIPDCWMKWPSLKYLNLGNNMMFGSVPDSIGHLRYLLSLSLHGNKFSGQIPLSIQKCSKLVKIDLSGNALVGNIPTWMGTTLVKLMILILRSNNFSGNIPSTICHLNTLQVLDLSNNNFSGVIPDCVHNLTAMAMKRALAEVAISPFFDTFIESVSVVAKGVELHYDTILVLVTNINLSNNNLSGGIPEELTRLVELKSLNLSGNHITGQIPHSIGNMTQLESLDLSRNSLRGEIPNSISAMSFLSHLNLSYNHLTGKIPATTQLQSMDASSFVENYLCGPPLPRNCSKVHGALQEENDNEESEIDWFYVLLVLGYVVGILVVCTTLLLNKSWREAYFEWWERVWDKFYVYYHIEWVRQGSWNH